MYRFLFRPKWIIFHVVVIVAAVGMLGLARWQWNRHLQRDRFVEMVEQRETAEPAPLVPLLTSAQPSDIEYRVVTATGHYLADRQLVEINQVHGGINGANVITPFQIDDGPIIIVNRGFVPTETKVPDPPTGTLLIGGLARTTEKHQTGQLTDNNDGATNEVRLIDLDAISKRFSIDVAPLYLEFRGSKPATPEPPVPVDAPDLSGGPPHVSYTVQWCIFSVAVVVGWVLAVRRSLRTRRKAADKAAKAATDADAISAELPVQPSV